MEMTGELTADPRLEVFRDFVNSLEHDAGKGGESGGRRS